MNVIYALSKTVDVDVSVFSCVSMFLRADLGPLRIFPIWSMSISTNSTSGEKDIKVS